MSRKVKRNTKAKQTVWNFLLDHAGEKFYLTQIAKKLGVSDSTVQQILERQVKKGVAKKEKLGNLSLYFIDQTNPLIKQEKVLRTVQVLETLVNQLKPWSQKIILYGSAATGENTTKSDIDLFVLANDKEQIYKIFSRSKIKDKVKLVGKNFLEWVEAKEKDKFFASQINKGKILWSKNEAI